MLVSVLLRLQERGIVGLPIHDAVIVPAFRAGEAKVIMEGTFEEHTEVEGSVKKEREWEEARAAQGARRRYT